MEPEFDTRSGYVGLLGRPNVGKSTILNGLIGRKLSITSPKPQTTRHTILGIHTAGKVQTVFIDTPGLHTGQAKAINRYMNRAASSVLGFVDVVVMVVEAMRWTEEDEAALRRLEQFDGPVILAVNKVDRVSDKADLLPFLEQLSKHYSFANIIPVSATKNENMDALQVEIEALLPSNPFFFAEDQLSTASARFIASEVVREKLMRRLNQELPYSSAVEIEQFEEDDTLVKIGAIIWIERDSQKSIVIGKGGENLKEVGRLARLDLQQRWSKKVFIRTWVKVREGWSDDERALHSLGYGLED